jgi:GxxExxY protein
MAKDLIEKELSEQIVQAGRDVYNMLGPGFVEDVYREAMIIALTQAGLTLECKKPVDVLYRGEKVGKHVIEILVNQKVILKTFAMLEFQQVYRQHALSELKAVGLELAIILNFGAKEFQVGRVVNIKRKKQFPEFNLF